jgi:hypothetical protein
MLRLTGNDDEEEETEGNEAPDLEIESDSDDEKMEH